MSPGFTQRYTDSNVETVHLKQVVTAQDRFVHISVGLSSFHCYLLDRDYSVVAPSHKMKAEVPAESSLRQQARAVSELRYLQLSLEEVITIICFVSKNRCVWKGCVLDGHAYVRVLLLEGFIAEVPGHLPLGLPPRAFCDSGKRLQK